MLKGGARPYMFASNGPLRLPTVHLHSVTLKPPSHCHLTPLRSSDIVCCPRDDGRFRNCVRANHQGEAHKKNAHSRSRNSRGATFDISWESGEVSVERMIRDNRNARITRQPHLAQVLRLRIAIVDSKTSRWLSA